MIFTLITAFLFLFQSYELSSYSHQIEKAPVILIHGILSTKDELAEADTWFAKNLDRNVYRVEIGNGRLDSVFKPMSWQLNSLHEAINSLELNQPFHIVGFSQGGLLARAFAETSEKKRVKTLITFGTPHMGVYYYSDEHIYSYDSQSRLSYTNYWKDPYMLPLYLSNSTFLASLNGEVKSGLSLSDKVDDFVMVWSPYDEVIVPVESGKYEFYGENTQLIVPLRKSETFKKDYIGIRKMFDENRIHFVETDCAHKDYKSVSCLEKYRKYILKFLY